MKNGFGCMEKGAGSMSEKLTYVVDVKMVTDAAILVTMDGIREHWLPLSQIDCLTDPVANETCTIDVPEWLAVEKELE
jgi:hypothetical protein